MSAEAQTQVLVVSPNPTDGESSVAYLARRGILAEPCAGIRALAARFNAEVGCIILVEDALIDADLPVLEELLLEQPSWADVPLILIAYDITAMAEVVSTHMKRSGNVTLLERPLNPLTLATAAHVGLKASAHQRAVRDMLEARECAVKSRDEFIAMLSHELRNPLASMRNAVAIQKSCAPDDMLLVKTQEILDRQMNHLVRMLGDLLDVARLEHGKIALKIEPADLNEIVRRELPDSIAHLAQGDFTVALDLYDGPLPIEGDATRIGQILNNLLSNAGKYSPAGAIIDVNTRVEEGRAVLVVRDHGIGIAQENLESLFELFVQGRQTLARSEGGLGVGLSIARHLAALHSGTIQAHSEGLGKGASFTVRLPLAAHPATEPHEMRAGAMSQPVSKRVLVVDDNKDNRETLGLLLGAMGHSVSLAADGYEALNEVSRQLPDVALIDIGLPGIDGYEVAHRIRASGLKPPRLIALTGYGQPSDEQAALAAGFDVHLVKPVDPCALGQVICGVH